MHSYHITITMPDGSEYPAQLIGRDAASDLAVLKIARPKPFPFVEFGDSSKARVGDWVIAIGNPFGLGATATAGIVSAVPLNDGQLSGLKAALVDISGKSVHVELDVDPALIGGLVVKLGSRMIDTSLKTKLDALKIALKEVG